MATKKKKENVVFLNITIVDASLAVKEKVMKRMEKLPKPVQNQAAHAATYFTGRRKTAQVLSQRFCRELPRTFAKKGVTITVEEVFREGPYVVLKLKVLNVDSESIDRNWLRWFTRNIGFKDQIEENLLPNLVAKQLTETMPALVDERMAQSKITAETKVNIRSKQEEYFQMKLEEISEEIETRKRNKSLQKIRRRLSLSSGGDSKRSIDEERQPQNDEQSVSSEPNNLRAKLKKRLSSVSMKSTFSSDEGDKENTEVLDLTEDDKPSRWRRLRGDRNDCEIMEV
ncbi:unnamed protein product [Cylindrotheca closterium]|uniref:Uncharacterized protein n=1 Tax=Cylindrotheca closterium TaxID=2856 RepID=A0AAD2JHJ7_9STRA|nr:unnamed protein product [Cylindrotheca closterium]